MQRVLKKVRQSNLVSRSPTCPTLTGGKAYRYLIAYAHELLKKDPELRVFTLRISELSNFLGERPVDFLPKIEALFHMSIRWNLLPQQGSERIIEGKFHLLSQWAYKEDGHGSASLTFSFPEVIREEILHPRYFRAFLLDTVRKFRSKYALQLYNYLFASLNPGEEAVQTEWLSEEQLRSLLGCEKRYPVLKDFHKWVLFPAVGNINTVSEILVQLFREGRGAGRRKYRFLVTRKPQALTEHPVTLHGLPGDVEPEFCRVLPLEEAPPRLKPKGFPDVLPKGFWLHGSEETFLRRLAQLVPGNAFYGYFSHGARLAERNGTPCLLLTTELHRQRVLERFARALATAARQMGFKRFRVLSVEALSPPPPSRNSPPASEERQKLFSK